MIYLFSMNQFICRSEQGSIVPVQLSKKKLLKKLLDSYEERELTFKVTVEVIVKNINEQQKSLYNAFIIKASEHFGVSFKKMEEMLTRFYPEEDIFGQVHKKPKSIWSTKELNDFIDKASSVLSEQGFHF